MARIVQLYTTAGCHLCEQVEEMMQYLIANDSQVAQNYSLVPVEIAGDEALVERYGISIPVLKYANNELGWPFELEELRDWLFVK